MESQTFKYNDLSEWDKTFLQSLSLYERHSKCAAKNVACILTKDYNILSIGINGTLQGKTNCNELFKKSSNRWFKKLTHLIDIIISFSKYNSFYTK